MLKKQRKGAQPEQAAQVPLDVQNSMAIKRLEEAMYMRDRVTVEKEPTNLFAGGVNQCSPSSYPPAACGPTVGRPTIMYFAGNIHDDISALASTIDLLGEKLKPILMLSPPTTAVPNSPPAPAPYLNTLQTIRERLRELRYKANEMLDSLVV